MKIYTFYLLLFAKDLGQAARGRSQMRLVQKPELSAVNTKGGTNNPLTQNLAHLLGHNIRFINQGVVLTYNSMQVIDPPIILKR